MVRQKKDTNTRHRGRLKKVQNPSNKTADGKKFGNNKADKIETKKE